MPELAFQVRGAEAMSATTAPSIALHLDISSKPATQAIQTVLLNCQVQIEAPRRRYATAEKNRLRDLFGEPERWGQTLRPLLWANLTTTVPGFTGSVGTKLQIPCTFDFNIGSTKYFHAVEGGAVPLSLLFSGTIFYRTDDDLLQAAPIPWNTEAQFALPAGIWKECMELHYPNTARLALRRDTFERLNDFKIQHGLATFDEAIERIVDHAVLEAKA